MKPVRLPGAIAEQLRDQALRNANVEICGLISERAGWPRHVYAVRNIAADPGRFYEMDPAEQIHAMKTMRENGESLFAIYHSHPNGSARPSATDLEQAAYPDALYLIVATGSRDGGKIHGYYLRENRIENIRLKIA